MRDLALPFVFIILAVVPAASAEPTTTRPVVTVEAILPGCHSLLASKGVPTTAEAGFCNGLIDGLLYLGVMIPADFCFVVPPDIPHHRVVAAIVEEIEPIYASVKTQHFRALAIDVLEHKWPCHIQPTTPSVASRPHLHARSRLNCSPAQDDDQPPATWRRPAPRGLAAPVARVAQIRFDRIRRCHIK